MAIFTRAVEDELMALDQEPILRADGLIQIAVIQHGMGQIHHSAAAGANKVTVGGNAPVEPLLSLDDADALDQALLWNRTRLR